MHEGMTAYPTVPMSDRAIRERYGLEVKTRDCLVEHGYDISDPPSEQAWVEQFTDGTHGLWLPYYEVLSRTAITAAEEAALKIACPDPAEKSYSR